MANVIEVSKGQDFNLEYRIRAGDGRGKPITVTLTADALAGATSLSIRPDHPNIEDNDVLLFGEDVVVVVNGSCLAGDTSLAVDATACALKTGDVLAKLRDLTGYTVQLEVLSARADATPALAGTDTTVTIPTQTGNDYGKLTIAGLTSNAQVAALEVKSYFFALWRRDSGNKRVLDEGDFRVKASGFL